ncbi:retrovirus-related pol polyprotein from transposon TNT 1-94 [Tanacetum coccineum]
MHNKFEISIMRELKFFLGIQIYQFPHGIFINQTKYAQEILNKHGMTSCDSIGTPMSMKQIDADLRGALVNQTKYRSMVEALMYLIASRPDIVHAICYCARYQARPTEKHLTAVKRIFCLDSRKSTSGGIQFLGGDKLVMWSSKKQDCTSMSSVEADHSHLVQSSPAFPYQAHRCQISLHKGIDRFKYLVRRLGLRCLTPEELEVLANTFA